MKRAVTVLALAVVMSLSPTTVGAAAPKTIDFEPHQVVTKKQADKHLNGTPVAFRTFVVKQVRKTKKQARAMLGDEGYAAQAQACRDAGELPASVRTFGYHRRGIALGSLNLCVLSVTGGTVVVKRVDGDWRLRHLGTAAPTCQQLAKHRVPRALYRTMTPSGVCLDDETGEAEDYRS